MSTMTGAVVRVARTSQAGPALTFRPVESWFGVAAGGIKAVCRSVAKMSSAAIAQTVEAHPLNT